MFGWFYVAAMVLSIVAAIWAFMRNRRKPEVDESVVAEIAGVWIVDFRGRTHVFPATCGLEHPIKLLLCQLTPNHVGVHECRGSRWYGNVVFPRSTKQIDGLPKYNPYVAPTHTSKEHA